MPNEDHILVILYGKDGLEQPQRRSGDSRMLGTLKKNVRGLKTNSQIGSSRLDNASEYMASKSVLYRSKVNGFFQYRS